MLDTNIGKRTKLWAPLGWQLLYRLLLGTAGVWRGPGVATRSTSCCMSMEISLKLNLIWAYAARDLDEAPSRAALRTQGSALVALSMPGQLTRSLKVGTGFLGRTAVQGFQEDYPSVDPFSKGKTSLFRISVPEVTKGHSEGDHNADIMLIIRAGGRFCMLKENTGLNWCWVSQQAEGLDVKGKEPVGAADTDPGSSLGPGLEPGPDWALCCFIPVSASQIAEVQISSSEIGQKFFTLKEPAPLTSLNSSSRKTTGKCFKMLSLDTDVHNKWIHLPLESTNGKSLGEKLQQHVEEEGTWGEATTAHGGGGQHSLAGHLRQPWYSRDLRGGEKLCLQGKKNSNMTNRRQNVAFSCQLAAFTLVPREKALGKSAKPSLCKPLSLLQLDLGCLTTRLSFSQIFSSSAFCSPDEGGKYDCTRTTFPITVPMGY
ncbi:hypothetical protein Anapl_09468 [Anas platyrhynchos]|uniref:Uncharacterized protein n=1 Tax=Anas platyrhynchos TaxID=8839 RepID=R0JYE5_ANAPL|nr:hypothetical protein Anapl_09468 [Anas platyrhynchos]